MIEIIKWIHRIGPPYIVGLNPYHIANHATNLQNVWQMLLLW